MQEPVIVVNDDLLDDIERWEHLCRCCPCCSPGGRAEYDAEVEVSCMPDDSEKIQPWRTH